MSWILRSDGALCLDGYPIRIKNNRHMGWLILESDWHGTALPYFSLGVAKAAADRLVREINEFTSYEDALK